MALNGSDHYRMKTNATRRLDKLGIAYELREYEVDLEDLGATKVASRVGLSAHQPGLCQA
jgi:Cys-tRNA(Pro)/Cys-tRNA(Cys) deacylase